MNKIIVGDFMLNINIYFFQLDIKYAKKNKQV